MLGPATFNYQGDTLIGRHIMRTDEGKPDSKASKGLPSTFRYTKQVMAGDQAILEFETEMDGKYINGVDIIRCNDEGKIVEFRVMVRPLQAVNLLHKKMAAMLERMKPTG